MTPATLLICTVSLLCVLTLALVILYLEDLKR